MAKFSTLNTLLIKALIYPCIFFGFASQGQDSKSTGEVQLLSNLSAEVSMTEEQVTLTLNGPANQWFAIGFGASNMAVGTDVAFYATVNGVTTLYDGRLPGQGTPVADQSQDWELLSNTVDGSVRTIVATRPLNTGDPDDFVFNFNASTLQVIYAHATSASTALAYHGGNRGAQLLQFIVFDCPSLAANIGDPCDANGAPGQINQNCDCVAIDVCTANGGTLEAPANRSFCVGTGSPVGINVAAVGASGASQRWALIDGQGNILETRGNNSLFNLDAQTPGDYSIRYIRFDGDVTNLTSITNISQANSLVGCFGLASNSIAVFLREEPVAGTLTALTSTTFCASSGAVSGIQVAISGNEGENGRFGITSSALANQIVSSNTTGTFNLNSFAPGNYTVAYISFQQGASVASAQFVNQIQGCFDLSNFINVTIQNCAGVVLESLPNPTSGASFVSFSTTTDDYTTLEVYDMGGRMVQRIFNQATVPGQEYRLEFDGSALPNGVYLYRLTTASEVVVDKFMIAR